VAWHRAGEIRYNLPAKIAHAVDHKSAPSVSGEKAMSRHFGWAMLIAAGMVLGGVLGSYERSHAAPARDAAADEQDVDLADQVREIKNEVKEINKLLQSGKLRVVVVINPDAR
jgi:hypothetical protein